MHLQGKPARVIATCIVARKRAGCFVSFARRFARLLPLSTKACKLCIAHGKHGDFSTRKNCVQCNEYNLQDNLPNNGSGIIACRSGKCVLCVEKSTYKRVDVCHSQISFQDSFQIRFFRQFCRRKNCVRKARTLFECNKNIAKQTALVRLCPFVPYSVMLTLSVAAVATVHKNLSATVLLLILYTVLAVLSTPCA